MTKKEEEFFLRAIIRKEKYAEIASSMEIPRKQLSEWWKNLKKEREQLSKIKTLWRRKCNLIDFCIFYKWYVETERKCHYCGINEESIAQLIASYKIYTKRITTRGRSLEIERKQPNEAYDNTENLVWCCYWCNNAKSDEFTEEEFKPIGKLIGEILINRKS